MIVINIEDTRQILSFASDKDNNTTLKSTFSVILAATRENLSSGFPTKRDSNQSPQVQRLASLES